MSSIQEVLETPELIQNILFYADYDTVLNYCQTSKEAMNICKNSVFWEEKAEKILNIPRDLFRMSYLTPMQRYYEFINSEDGVPIYDKYLTLDKFVRFAFELNNQGFIDYAMRRGYKNYTQLTYGYAKLGDKNTVDYYLSIDGNYWEAARGAVEGNHINLCDYLYALKKFTIYDMVKNSPVSGNILLFDHVLFIIKRDDPKYNIPWNEILNSAIESRSYDMFMYINSIMPPDTIHEVHYLGMGMLNIKGGTALRNNNINVFNYYREYASHNYKWNYNILIDEVIRSENLDLVKYILSIVPSGYDINWEYKAKTSLYIGNKEIFDYIRTLTDLNYWDWNNLLASSIQSGDKYLFNHVLSLAPPDYIINWNELALDTARFNRFELFKQILRLAPENYLWNLNWNLLASYASEKDNTDFFGYILSLAPPDYSWNWNYFAEYALDNKNITFFDYLRSIAPTDYSWDWIELIARAVEDENRELFDYLQSLTPIDYQWDWQKLLAATEDVRDLRGNRGRPELELYNYIRTMANT